MTPAKQIDSFLAKYTPKNAAQAKACLKKLRKLLPHSFEMVYDNYNALVFGFGPTDKPSDLVLSLALYPKWVTLFFAQGKGLPDPQKLLEGSGARFRSIRLAGPDTLDDPAVGALIKAAPARGKPMDLTHKHVVLVRSISAKQRPRRPA